MATPNQQFCLRWNNHQPNFIAVFSTLLRSESMCDVTLATEGKHILAHKIVLSACSSYFQMLFSINPCKHPIVILKDVQFKDLKTLIDFIYFGEVNVSQEHLPSLLKTAETLQIKGLTEMPEKQITLNSIPSVGVATPTENRVESPLGSPGAYKRKRMRKTSGDSSVGGEDGGQGESTINRGDLQGHLSMIKPEPHVHELQRQPTPQMEDRSPRSASMGSAEAGPSSGNKSGGWVEPPPHVINIYSTMENVPTPTSYAGEGGGAESYSEFPQEATPVATTRKKRYNSCSSQDRERFNEALEAVRYGGIGFCKAARLYGVNNRSLWLEYKKRGYPTLRPGPKLKSKDPAVQAAAAAAAAATAAAVAANQQLTAQPVTTSSQRSQTVQTATPQPRELHPVHRDVQQRLMAVSSQGAVTSVQQVTSVADYNQQQQQQQLTTSQPGATFFQSTHLTSPFAHYYHNPPL